MLTDETKTRWRELFKKSDWYIAIVPEIEAMRETLKGKSESDHDTAVKELYDFFELHLGRGDIALEKNPPNTDAERKPIDAIIIHHTSNPPGMSKDRLSAIELMRLYAPYFYRPKDAADASMKGRAIYSGHVRNGRQVFWPYHWFVRADGAVERLLEDAEIGWQAGDWDMNRRSVAICFDNDFENSAPSPIELRAAADIITKYYSDVSRERILGHGEINNKTTCPSSLFLSTGAIRGWKEDLIFAST